MTYLQRNFVYVQFTLAVVSQFPLLFYLYIKISKMKYIFVLYWNRRMDGYEVKTQYCNGYLSWCDVSRRVDEVIPLDHLRCKASRVIQWYGNCTSYQVTIIIICLLLTYTFFMTLLRFYNLFLVLNPKIVGTFDIMLPFLLSRHHVFHLWFHSWNLLYVMLQQKQVKDISLKG